MASHTGNQRKLRINEKLIGYSKSAGLRPLGVRLPLPAP
jgi:hypothetical protein